MTTLALQTLTASAAAAAIRPGALVEVPHLRIGARVLADSEMFRPAQPGHVWVRETGLHVNPRDAWRGEVEISRIVPVV